MADLKFTMVSDLARIMLPWGLEERQMSYSAPGTYVQFEGDSKPRGFRAPAQSASWPMTVVFQPSAGANVRSFLTMLEDAHASTEPRFILEFGDKFGDDILESALVEIHDWKLEIRKPSGIYAVSFTAQQVK